MQLTHAKPIKLAYSVGRGFGCTLCTIYGKSPNRLSLETRTIVTNIMNAIPPQNRMLNVFLSYTPQGVLTRLFSFSSRDWILSDSSLINSSLSSCMIFAQNGYIFVYRKKCKGLPFVWMGVPTVPMQLLVIQRGPLAKGNLQTPQLYGYFRGVNMFEDSDEGF